ncbi:motile sperm domain-containing protein 2-like [Scaptodrosophila lebanonensis]|uniref:Motile sperm domain-containing protein 2-like n=1 Tax=Drosophila lebanonensis TaxID=7225 RepID=A0A6J2T9A0_DROLE|nr:motile sperm domain-containing protein 2-like [Scaptodrosophila lebanonensis]
MGIKVKVPTVGQIEELRQKFNEKYDQTPPAAPFHPVDMDRIRNDNLWLQRFLEMYDLEMETALTKLWDTCIWRQEYGANELNETNLNSEYLDEGSVFVHNHDIDGKPLLIFRVKLHNKSKNLDELIRLVVYWVERTQREQHLIQLSIFFDMAGTGLATMDLDFVKRIIETFKLYYPNTLNYILVYELAWVLNAAFKIVKTLLPPKAVEILKMISKKDVTQYVHKDNCLTNWGGNDTYEYSFVPEPKSVSLKTPTNGVQAANAGDEEPALNGDKKVHFANSVPTVMPDLTDYAELHTPGENMLALEPCDYVNFDSQSAEATLNIKCVGQTPVTYKIQTTSPEKFRVRPRCGVLGPNESTEVNIWLKSEHSLSEDAKDKFLVMGMPAVSKDCGASEVADMWKNKPQNCPDVEQHRLVCRFASPDQVKGSASAASCKQAAAAPVSPCGAAASKKALVKPAEDEVTLLQRNMAFTRNLQYIQLFVLLLLAAGLGYLLYQQHHQSNATGGASHGSCYKTQAHSCAKRK